MPRIGHDRLREFVAGIFAHAGSERAEAEAVAGHLVDSNLVGHDSHGVIRVARYLGWVRDGRLRPNQHARVVRDGGAVVTVDGGGGYGQVIGREATDIGIERSGRHGIAAVAIRNTGHLGRIGAWAEQAALAGRVSVHLVNSTGFGILVAPFGGTDRRMSANPIAAGAPVPDGGPLVLDIATASVAEGKIRVARNRGELLPEGSLLDARGRPTRDPEVFYADPPGAILPFGGHKGSGLAYFCEVLAGTLTGGGSSHPDNPDADRMLNNMLSLFFDPAAFGDTDAFAADLVRLAAWVKGSPPAVPGGEVLLPGEVERLAHGVPLDDATLDQLAAAAASVGAPDTLRRRDGAAPGRPT